MSVCFIVLAVDVDRLYRAAEHKIDSVSLGAFCILAAGVAVTLGPLTLGVLADSIGLRRALLIVPVSCVVGAITQWRLADSVGVTSVPVRPESSP